MKGGSGQALDVGKDIHGGGTMMLAPILAEKEVNFSCDGLPTHV
jgi:hypothetical protein